MENILLGNRYRILEQISEGGMSKIYKAYCTVLNRTVAIKILKEEFAKDEEFLVKFRNEATNAAALNHPNITAIYDVGMDDQIAYIVMEYIDGINLKDLIRQKGPVSENEALYYTRQICLALREAHSKGIIHRDIKPHNIMLTNSGIVKVGDFGIAKAATSSTITSSGNIIGSVYYFSPEQARGGYIDERSDIYSLGIVLYELLEGHPPFEGDSPINIALKHLHDEIEFPPEMTAKVSKSTINLIKKMTQKNVAKRYSNVEHIIYDINNIQNGVEPQYSYVSDDAEFETKVMDLSALDKEESLRNFRDPKISDPTSATEELFDRKKQKRTKVTTAEKVKNKKKRKGKKAISIIAILLLILMLWFAYISTIGAKPKVQVPSLKGQTEEVAQKTLEDVGLKMEIKDRKPNSKYEPNSVIYQAPSEGMYAKKGSVVTVTLSLDSEEKNKESKNTISVPKLVGNTVEEAKKIIEPYNIELSKDYAFSDEVEEGTIISQSPEKGDDLEEGGTVKIIVSKGPEENPVKIPSIEGMNLQQAKQALEEAGFTVGDINTKQDQTKSDSVVLSSEPSSGSMVKKGSAINLTINKIEKQEEKPKEEPKAPQIIKKQLAVTLPQKESLKILVRDMTNGKEIYSNTLNTTESYVISIDVSAKQGETKQYEIFIDGVLYTQTDPIVF